MGLFDELSEIVKEVKGVGEDIQKEFNGLKSDVASSVTDIRSGVAETADGVKKKVKSSVSMDGMIRSGKKMIDVPSRPSGEAQSKSVHVKGD